MSAPHPTPYRLIDHVCRVCFGRLVARPGPEPTHNAERSTIYRCTNCGQERESTRPDSLCACGITLKTGRNAGLRCIRNASPSPECPSEIVVEETVLAPGRATG